MAVVPPIGKEGLLRSLFSSDDDYVPSSHKFFEGEIRNGEMYHNGKWCKIIDRIGNIYKIEKKG